MYQTAFVHWAGPELAGFMGDGVLYEGSQLALDLKSAGTETDPGGMYNGATYKVATATGPIVETGFGFTEAIASWNADTPLGTWIEVLLEARLGETWTKAYNLGVWAAGDRTIHRHSVSGQDDANGRVAVDTLVLTGKKTLADAFRLKARLFSADAKRVPALLRLGVNYNEAPKKFPPSKGNSGCWGIALDVPRCSQMVYPDGGNVWCSATSTSMVLGYWGIDPGPCEARVRKAAVGVYDWVYEGHGNWVFNTAYAGSCGMEAYVVRYDGLDKVEPWVKAGIPVVMSYAWKKNELTGAPISASNGHLAVLVGFDKDGNAIVNDPAAPTNENVRRTYLRPEFERLWLENSGGTVYLIVPPNHPIPGF